MTRGYPGLSGRRLGGALRAARREILDFRVEQPIALDEEAGAERGLHYHVRADRLFLEAMAMDEAGVPCHVSRTFETYNPAYVAWYGLLRLERWLHGTDPAGQAAFRTQLQWLTTHAQRWDGGGIVWPLTFDWREGRADLRAPWLSAMVQGLAMSALVRGYRLTGDARLLDLAGAATPPFDKSVEDGGVRTVEGGAVLYEEYPAYPLPRVLDGFLFALLGLYDLAAETGDQRAAQFLTDGVGGLARLLPAWDYRGKWTWYGTHGYLCPPVYHALNVSLLEAVARVAGQPVLAGWAARWNTARLTPADRLEVYLFFLLTKNVARLRYRRRRR